MDYHRASSERPVLADPGDPRLVRKVGIWKRIVAELTNPDLIALVALCCIGLLMTVLISIFVSLL